MTEQTFLDIPDNWRGIADIPQVEDMADRIKSDAIFADSFFFQETNNIDNIDSPIYQPLTPLQGGLFRTLDENDVVWVQGARGSSKSSGAARWLDGYALREEGIRAGLFAPTFRQSKQLHDYCVGYMQTNFGVDSHIYKLDSELACDPTRGQEVMMKFKNTSLIEALPSGDGSKLRGRRFNVIIIDEAYLLDEEFHRSHVLPMGNVKMGKRRTKVIYLTTSGYADVYAYSVLKGIAEKVAKGIPGFAIVDMRLQDVLESGFPFDKPHILHQLQDQTDKISGKLSDEAKMTFFNIWIKGGTSFYTSGMVTECQRIDVPVITKRPDGDKTPVVLGVDPATSGTDKCAMGVLACPGNNERYVRDLRQWDKQRPEEIAGNIHKMVDDHGMFWIMMDKSGVLGTIVADLCARETQLIDGTWQKRPPITLHDHPNARMSRAQIILTKPSDDKIMLAIMGPRYDSSLPGGEIDLKNMMHQNMKQVMVNGKFFAPKLLKDEDYYNSASGEAMDNIKEALGQFPKIDRKKAPNGKDLLMDSRGNFHFTRPAKDDGAYSLIYANFAANLHYRILEGRGKSDGVPFLWGTDETAIKAQAETSHKILLPKL